MEIKEARQKELASKIEEVMERYPKTFKEELTEEGLLKILEEIEMEGRKAWIKKIIGAMTFTDRSYLEKLFKTRKALKEIEDGEAKEKQGEEGAGAGEGTGEVSDKAGANPGDSEEKPRSKRGKGSSN